eukprot:scaffold2963_cov250-Pinguiococcus_pyrenoidosus.AAC.31
MYTYCFSRVAAVRHGSRKARRSHLSAWLRRATNKASPRPRPTSAIKSTSPGSSASPQGVPSSSSQVAVGIASMLRTPTLWSPLRSGTQT